MVHWPRINEQIFRGVVLANSIFFSSWCFGGPYFVISTRKWVVQMYVSLSVMFLGSNTGFLASESCLNVVFLKNTNAQSTKIYSVITRPRTRTWFGPFTRRASVRVGAFGVRVEISRRKPPKCAKTRRKCVEFYWILNRALMKNHREGRWVVTDKFGMWNTHFQVQTIS